MRRWIAEIGLGGYEDFECMVKGLGDFDDLTATVEALGLKDQRIWATARVGLTPFEFSSSF